MILTKRHNDILRAALSYAYSNVDDLNYALNGYALVDPEPGLVKLDNDEMVTEFTEEEILDLAKMFGIGLRNDLF